MSIRHLFSQRVGYAVHVLCSLARMPPLATIPVSELADKMARTWPNTSGSYLSKVVQALVQSGILVSLRGPGGGYSFARSPAVLSLLDVVTALDGRPQSHCPLVPSGRCAFQDRCENYRTLARLRIETSEFLARVSIEQLACNMPSGAMQPNETDARFASPRLSIDTQTSMEVADLPASNPACTLPTPEFVPSSSPPCGLSVFSG